jgi:hypothetical protein
VFKDGYCLFGRNGQLLSKDILKEAKIFFVDSRLFEEIRICLFDSQNDFMKQKIVRKVKYWIWDGSKWILTIGIPKMLECSWELLKMVLYFGGNFTIKHPKYTAAIAGGAFAEYYWGVLSGIKNCAGKALGFFQGSNAKGNTAKGIKPTTGERGK